MFLRMPTLPILKRLTKRQQFVIATVVVTLGLVATQLVGDVDYYILLTLAIALVAGVSGFLSLRSDAIGRRQFTSVFLLTLYTAAVSSFYFLLPARWLTRLPTALLFAIGFYAILLTENIYNVASGRSIQLLRAARSVGLLMSLITVFLLFETVLSFHLNAFLNGAVVFAVSLPLVYQNLWTVELGVGEGEGSMLFILAVLLALVIGEIGLGLSFWPVDSTLLALFLTALFYLVVGIFQHALVERLFPPTLRELILVAGAVFALVLLTTSWTG